jgi:hypothetical protein
VTQGITQVRSLDVPQADSLPLVRRVIEAVDSHGCRVATIACKTGFSERHVRYRLQAARILGLLSDDLSLTANGHRLLGTSTGSIDEIEILRQCVRRNKILLILAPGLLSEESLNIARASNRIESLARLSTATAERRAVVLRAWHRQLNAAGAKTKVAE